MAFVEAKNNYTGEVQMVAEEWLERWPEDYTIVNAPKGEKPSDGSQVEEKHHGR